MSNILVVAAMPPPVHGQSLCTEKIVSILNGSEFNVTVQNTSPESLNRGIKYHFRRICGHILALRFLLMHFVGFRRISALYTIFESGLGVLYNIIVVIFARICRVPVIIHHHTSFHAINYSRVFRVLIVVSGRMCRHIVLSQGMANGLISLYKIPPDGVMVLNNASLVSDGLMTRPEVKFDRQENFRIGFIGNICAEKGIIYIDRLIRFLVSEKVNFEFILCGPFADSTSKIIVENLINEFGGIVKYNGPVSGRSKIEFFEGLDLLVFPSIYKYEAQPLVLLEALSFGVPVVASDAGFIGELLGDDFEVVRNLNDFNKSVLNVLDKLKYNQEYFRSRSYARYLYCYELSKLNLRDIVVKFFRATDFSNKC